jgi:hypothetical protein
VRKLFRRQGGQKWDARQVPRYDFALTPPIFILGLLIVDNCSKADIAAAVKLARMGCVRGDLPGTNCPRILEG